MPTIRHRINLSEWAELIQNISAGTIIFVICILDIWPWIITVDDDGVLASLNEFAVNKKNPPQP